jgi:CRP-like cAMP-binding protein
MACGPDRPAFRQPFLRNLPNADLRRLVPHLRLTDLPREEIICREGDMIQSIIFPHDGIVSLTSLLTDGTINESATVGGEGYVGGEVMLGSAVAACSVIAQPGRVSTIALDRLLILLDQVPSLRPLEGNRTMASYLPIIHLVFANLKM